MKVKSTLKLSVLTLFLTAVLLSCSDNNDWRGNIYKFSQEIEDSIKYNDSEMMVQTAPTDYSFVPDYYRMKRAKEIFKVTTPNLRLDSAYHKTNAVNFIIDQAAKSEIVILNEAHHYPRHRSFATDLLAGLKQNGYKYLGIEALTNEDGFNSPDFPRNDIGYYTLEPMFSNFIREAIRLDFVLFPYEAYGKDGKEREIEQAENIAKFIKNNNDGKTFIYCGYAHNIETHYTAWEKAMAGRLIEYIGINPLTVNQTIFNDVESDNNESFVLVDSLNNGFNFSDINDIYVFHPIEQSDYKRLEWKKKDENNWLKVDFLPESTVYPVFVKVYYSQTEKDNNCIPYDIIEMTSENLENWLVVPNSDFVIVVEDVNRKEIILTDY